jgi:hypothetical protein
VPFESLRILVGHFLLARLKYQKALEKVGGYIVARFGGKPMPD